MKSSFAKVVSRLLIALMIWTPYQFAQAGMIGTDQVAQTSQADRGTVLSFVSRADVAGQLQAFGLDSATAKDRVAAMTDQELRYLAGQIESQPAGANNTAAAVILIIIIAAVVWWAWKR
jgi:hypothetical protein